MGSFLLAAGTKGKRHWDVPLEEVALLIFEKHIDHPRMWECAAYQIYQLTWMKTIVSELNLVHGGSWSPMSIALFHIFSATLFTNHDCGCFLFWAHPILRTTSRVHGHPYARALMAPAEARVCQTPAPRSQIGDRITQKRSEWVHLWPRNYLFWEDMQTYRFQCIHMSPYFKLCDCPKPNHS